MGRNNETPGLLVHLGKSNDKLAAGFVILFFFFLVLSGFKKDEEYLNSSGCWKSD